MKRIKLVVFFILGLFMLTSCSMFSHESFPSGPQIEEPGTNPDGEVSSYLITYYENGLKVHQESLESGKALPQVESTKAPIGQEFMGWSTSKEEYVPVDFDVMPESDVDLYAFYQNVKYTITFNANINLPDGTTTTKEYEYHDRLSEFVPSDLQEIIDAQTDYVFVGWFLDSQFKEEFVEVSMPAEDIVLYAKWQFSGIRFMNGLEVFYEVKDDEGAAVQAPLQNPTKPGYDFVGWVDAKGNAVSFPLIVTDEVQFIYAAFEAKNNMTYKVEHYLENLNGTFVRQEVEELFGSTDSEVEALWKSYTGFSKDETNENNVLKGIVNYNGTLVLKLYYSRNSYKVSFETNGGSAIQAVSYKYEQMVAAPSSPNKLGYTFAGWELNGESYSFTNMPAHDIELSAKWQVVEYTVTFVATELVGKVTYTVENKNITEPAVPAIEHFTGAWEEYELTTGNITVKAVYTPVTYTVTFKAEGVTVDTENYTVVNPTINEPSVPAKEHYTGAWESYVLVGGNVEVEAVYTPVTYYVTFVAEGTEVAKLPYTVENKTVVNPAVPEKTHYTGVWESYTLTSGNVEVEAVYTPVTYYVTFVAEGTEVAKLPYTVENKAVVNPAVPAKAHYTGVWESYTLTSGNVEVEAVYTPVTYYVTFVAEGTEVAKLPYTVENKAVVNPAVPTKAHYTGVWESYTLTSGNVEVEAVYTPVTYTVTFKDGDSLIGSDAYTIVDTNITEPALPTKAHYTSAWAAYVLDGGNKEVQVVYTPVTYYVTFVAEGTEIAKLPYTVENTTIVEPAVPAKTGYTAAWKSYSVVNGNITVNAVYTIISYEINWDLSGGNLSTYTCTDREVIAAEYLKDFNTFYGTSFTSVASLYRGVPDNSVNFWKDSAMRTKWMWLFEEIRALCVEQGRSTEYIDGVIAGTGTSGYALQNIPVFLLQINSTIWNANYKAEYGSLASGSTTADATAYNGYSMELPVNLPSEYTVNDSIVLPTPTKLGYEFLGWYVEGNKVTEISKGSTGDKNLFAMWKLEEYALSWELDGGLLPQYTCTDRETIAQEFLKDMNNFYNASYESVASYWKTNRTDFWKDSEMRAKWLWIWDEIRDLAIAQSQDTKYIDDLIAGTAYSGYALQNVMIYFLQINNSIWVSNYQSQYGGLASRFTTVDASEATYEMELPVSLPDIYTVNDGINLPILTKKGYSFLGWYIEGNKVTEIAKGSTGNKVLVAMWKVNEYEIQYEVNGGTQPVNGIDYSDATLKDNITITDYLTYQSSTGAEVALHNKVPAKYWGYITLKETEFSNVYTIVQIVSGSANVTKDYDLVIMWHSGCTDTATKTMLDNILKNSSSYIGDYVVLSNVPGASTSTCDIKASIYNKNEVVITKAPQYKYQEGVEYILPVPTKEHYTFAGWYTNPEFTGEKVTIIDNATTGNVKLYAKWTPVEYTVTFKSEVAEDIVKTYTVDNTTIEEPTVPTKVGYTGVWESYTLTSGNVEVNAVYTINQYKVTFMNGSDVLSEETLDYGTTINAIAAPAKDGYEFIGWSVDLPTTVPASDLVIEAQWEKLLLEKDVEYLLCVDQVNLGKKLYVTGEVSNGRYLATTIDDTVAAKIFGEKVTGGYKFYILDGSTKKYLDTYLNSDSAISLQFTAESNSIYVYHEDIKAWVTNVDGTDYYFGTYSTFNTLSASKTSYINADNTGVSQFPGFFVKYDDVEHHTHTFNAGRCECGIIDPNYVIPDSNSNTADLDTMETNQSYVESTSINGWVAKNAAVLNDQAFIGNNVAVVINGKTSAIGTLTSPTLTGGIAKLTFNYGLPFTDTKIDFDIIITDLTTSAKYEYNVSNLSATKQVAYEETIILETVIKGDFSIQFINNSPSNSTKNKDRTALWNIKWYSDASQHEHEFINGACNCGELHDCVFNEGVCECGAEDPNYVPPQTEPELFLTVGFESYTNSSTAKASVAEGGVTFTSNSVNKMYTDNTPGSIALKFNNSSSSNAGFEATGFEKAIAKMTFKAATWNSAVTFTIVGTTADGQTITVTVDLANTAKAFAADKIVVEFEVPVVSFTFTASKRAFIDDISFYE